jgi:hypothetical protein
MADEDETRKQVKEDAVEDLDVDGKEVDDVRGGADPTPAGDGTALSNLANLRHEMLKSVVNNLRS